MNEIGNMAMELKLKPDTYDYDANQSPSQMQAAAVAVAHPRESEVEKITHALADSRVDTVVENEQFRRYLEETGTVSKLVTTLEKLFPQHQGMGPEDEREHFLSILGEGVKPNVELRALKEEVRKMEHSLDRILDENTSLRSLLSVPEPSDPASDEDDEFDEILVETLDDGDENELNAMGHEELARVYQALLQEEERRKLREHEYSPAPETAPQHDMPLGHTASKLEIEVLGEEAFDGPQAAADVEIIGEHEEEFNLLDQSYETSNVFEQFVQQLISSTYSEDEGEADGNGEGEGGSQYGLQGKDSIDSCVSDESDFDEACRTLEQMGMPTDGHGQRFEQEVQHLSDDSEK